jgi:AcrR family transcriptional regulator
VAGSANDAVAPEPARSVVVIDTKAGRQPRDPEGDRLSKPGRRLTSDGLGRPRLYDEETERTMVMDAAVRLMARNGFDNMSVADILSEAQLSTTSFYRHFQSKDKLLAALIRRDGESVQRALQHDIAAAEGPVAGLEAWLDGILDVLYQPRKAARTAIFITPEARSAYRNNVEILEMRWLLSEPLVEVLHAGHRAGRMNSPKPEADAVILFAVVSSAATAPHAFPRNRKAARAHAIRFIWPALGITDETGASNSDRSRQPRQQHAP